MIPLIARPDVHRPDVSIDGAGTFAPTDPIEAAKPGAQHNAGAKVGAEHGRAVGRLIAEHEARERAEMMEAAVKLGLLGAVAAGVTYLWKRRR